MTARSEFDLPTRFVLSILPWLLGGGMLLVYLPTLDHWVTPESLHQITSLSGLSWLAELSGPVTWLVTYPFRLLPAASIPVAINIFTACCAALALTLLARSVALLPHDRTQAERYRNANPQWFLSTANAWLPPVFAVCVCGLQLTFWENAIAATGEMFDLLLFAYAVRCLLEFRLTEKVSWLSRLAFVVGLGMANNWAMAAFCPAFVIAVLWVTGMFNFFSSTYFAKFLKGKIERFSLILPLKMLPWWLAGFAFIFLLPLVSSQSHNNRIPFFSGLHFVLHAYHTMLTALPFRTVLILSVTSLLPVFFMGIRWGRLMKNTHPWAITAVTMLFHVVHAFFFAACLWSAMDAPFSPGRVQTAFACLPLYYLGALSAGYFSGYFLLVFGPKTEPRRRPNPLAPIANKISIATMWAVLLVAPALLAHKNFADIRRRRHDPLAEYFNRLQQMLPPKGAVILSEDSTRLDILAASLIRNGRLSDYLLVDAKLLGRYPAYFQFLNVKHPDYRTALKTVNSPADMTNSGAIVRWVYDLSRDHPICFLHPFSGYLSEIFFAEPHGLYFQLMPYPTNKLDAPPMSEELIASNQEFWIKARNEQFPEIVQQIQPRVPSTNNDAWQWILKSVHTQPEFDRSAHQAGIYYAVMLNAWGVKLQQAGALSDAAKCFSDAHELNPGNVIAPINLECNRSLQSHTPLTAESFRQVEDKLGNRNWDQTLRDDGPADEPNACAELGAIAQRAAMYRQATQYYERASTLAPDDVNASLHVSELLLRFGDTSNALAAATKAVQLAPQNPRALVLEGLVLVQLKKFDEAIPVLSQVLAMQTNNVEARMTRAVSYLRINKMAAAKEDYEEVLRGAPKAYPADFGLAAIAYEEKNPAAFSNYAMLYLSNSPSNLPETAQLSVWQKELSKVQRGN